MTTVALVPAYRRADRVGATVAALAPLVDEVVVVDDGSGDDGATAAAARGVGARVVVLPVNRGKGGAVAAAMAAAPEADTYLLVDADTAATAAATAPLLDAVAAGADLAIGVLPPAGARAGLGSVRRVARLGILRACGFDAEAPLSGQRAVRGPLLRSLEPADRFGLEVGMTVDAVRAGAVVVEVPVAVGHAHTGRDVAGFAHRGAQGFDLVRALWPRLLAERTRLAVLVGAAVALVALLAVTGAAALPDGTPLAPADRVILVAAPADLDLDDLDDPARPELAALAGGRGAVAAANVDVADRSPWSSWATVGAGAKVAAAPPTRPIDPAQPFLVQDRVAGAGRLADALHAAGRTTAFVGTEVTSPVRLAVADSSGRIDRGATAGSFGTVGLANRVRAEVGGGASLIGVDGGALDPAGLEELLSRLRQIEPATTLLLVVTPADPGVRLGLRPLLASGPGAPAGRLLSPSTRRDGLVLLSDVAPTVLKVLSVPAPAEMVGRPLQRVAGSGDVAGLVDADRLARQRDTVWNRALIGLATLHVLVAAWALWRRRRRQLTGTPAAGGRALSWLALGLVGWPLATWLVRAVPGVASFGWKAGVLAVAFDAAVVTAAWRLGSRRGLAPLALVLAATLALVTVDLGLGGTLQVSSAFGGPAHATGRFSGLGNVAFAVYAGCALMAVACGRRRAPWMVAVLVGAALVVTLPSLGGDVGGAASLVPVVVLTLAGLAALGGRIRLRIVALAGAATVTILGASVLLDLSRPDADRTHLGRFVAGGGRSSSIGGKLSQNLDTYRAFPPLLLIVGVAAVLAVLLWRGRFAHALPPGAPARIAVAGAVGVALLGNLLNDSGAIVTVVVLSVVSPYLMARSVVAEEPESAPAPPAPVLAASPGVGP